VFRPLGPKMGLKKDKEDEGGRTKGRKRHVHIGIRGHDEIAPPLVALHAPAGLDLTHALVHGKRHSVARDDGVEDRVGPVELGRHIIERIHSLSLHINFPV
jgi:hypothetical protein